MDMPEIPILSRVLPVSLGFCSMITEPISIKASMSGVGTPSMFPRSDQATSPYGISSVKYLFFKLVGPLMNYNV